MSRGTPTGEDEARQRRVFLVAGAVTGVVMLVTMVVVAVMIFGRDDDDDPATAATPTADAESAYTLQEAAALRSAPSMEAAIVMRLDARTPVQVLGRSVDSEWVVSGPADQRDAIGWLPAGLIDGLDEISTLSVVTDSADPTETGTPEPTETPDETPSPTATPDPTPEPPPDHPALRVVRAFSFENQVWTEIANEGGADAEARIFVSFNEGPEHLVEQTESEAIAAGDSITMMIPDAYVQLRSTILVRISTDPELEGASEGRYSWLGAVEPDLPNDLELLTAVFLDDDDDEDGDGHLRVTVRNNSPIPFQGNVTVTVREADEESSMLERRTEFIELPVDGTIDFDFEEITDFDLEEINARVSSDAIADDDLGNNVYPRE